MMFLARGDYSQIEARVLPWLAGAEWKLDAFRAYDAGTGPDLYRVAAASVYGGSPEDITSAQRQQGKVAELALGFQGGPDALQNMARAYGAKVPMHPRGENGRPDLNVEPETGSDQWIVQRWRKANPEVADRETGLWRQLETAAADCVRAPAGEQFFVGKLRFRRNGKAMTLRLPSGRSLFYWNPALKRVTTSWGAEKWVVVYRAEDAVTKRWDEFKAYGGLWTENAVQATARDVMLAALLNCEECGLRPVLTVHDEVICEMHSQANAEAAANLVRKAMLDLPDWTDGLPVACEASAAKRYLKA
jgi:DNA polymerase bacteriophage-type